MGSMAQPIVAQIAATPAIVSLVADRVYPNTIRIADKQYPLIAYKVDNTTSIQTYDAGPVNPLRSCNIAIACIAETYGAADTLASAVLTAFDGASGTWGATVVDGVSTGGTVVQGCFLQDDGITDDVITQEQTEEILFYIKEVSFLCWFVS